MRTIIDIPKELLSTIAKVTKQQKISRSELVRRALYSYVSFAIPQKKDLSTHKAIGLWTNLEDSLEYQRKLREEW